MNRFIDSLTSWWKKPYDSQGNAFQWIMFVGVLVIAAFLWQTVLIGISREV